MKTESSSQDPEVEKNGRAEFRRGLVIKSPAKKFEDLIVWKKAHSFVLKVYSFSSHFPKDELFGLTSQFRRAAVSIAANIAEGFKKKSGRDKVRFYNIAQGSLEECRYYLILADDLGYGKNAILGSLLEETSKLLEAYSGSIMTKEEAKL